MPYKEREVREVDNKSLHKSLDLPGRRNVFSLMVTNSLMNLDNELRGSYNRCLKSWDFSTNVLLTIRNELDKGAKRDRFGEPMKTSVVLDAGTAIECFDTPFTLANKVEERAKQIVHTWNTLYSDVSMNGKRSNPGYEFDLGTRMWKDKNGKMHKTDIVLILDTFRFTRDNISSNRKVIMNLDNVDVVLKYRSTVFVTPTTSPFKIFEGMAYMAGGLRCTPGDFMDLLYSRELEDCLKHAKKLVDEEKSFITSGLVMDSTFMYKDKDAPRNSANVMVSEIDHDKDPEDELASKPWKKKRMEEMDMLSGDEFTDEEKEDDPAPKDRGKRKRAQGEPQEDNGWISEDSSEDESNHRGNEDQRGSKAKRQKGNDQGEKKDKRKKNHQEKFNEDSDESDVNFSDLENPQDYVPKERPRSVKA